MRISRSVLIGFLVLGAMWSFHFAAREFGQSGSIAQHTKSTTEGPSPLVRSLRPSYPFSVIAGGAYSPNELRFADSKDPVVRSHYSDFDMKHAKVVRLVDDHYQYVSYRIKNQVYWTKHKLRIPSGELLLTDGTQYARARCGNRLSDQSHPEATSTHEPPASALSLPPVNMDMLPQLALASPPEKREIPADPRTAAETPAAISGVSAAPVPLSQPYLPFAQLWGGQPVLGGFPLGGSSNSGAGAPTLPPTLASGAASNPLPPPGDPSKPPVEVAQVPEANTAYMIFVTLVFATWAILRSARKSKKENGGQATNS